MIEIKKEMFGHTVLTQIDYQPKKEKAKSMSTYDRLVSLLQTVETSQDTIAFLIASAWAQGSITTSEARHLCHNNGIVDIMTYWKNSCDSIV